MPIYFTSEELQAWLRLSLEPGLGHAQARALLGSLGLPTCVYESSSSTLSRHLPQNLVAQMRQAPSPEIQEQIARSLQWAEQEQHHILTLADAHYPPALLELHDPPLVLYVNGKLDYLQRPALAMVGARSATPGGMEIATDFARYLATHGWVICSGLASGIDQAAHRGALLAGPDSAGTLAIMGTGIDIVYPARHRSLAHEIVAHGALISEFALGSKALPYHFPRRNRLVAALSKGVLVVEAAKQSGSLITARLASEMGRDVFAIPGSIHSPLSRGCHALIRQGAKLVEQAADILEELSPGQARPCVTPAKPDTDKLSGPAMRLLTQLSYAPQGIEQLSVHWSDTPALLAQALLELELAQHIVRLDDGRIQRMGN